MFGSVSFNVTNVPIRVDRIAGSRCPVGDMPLGKGDGVIQAVSRSLSSFLNSLRRYFPTFDLGSMSLNSI